MFLLPGIIYPINANVKGGIFMRNSNHFHKSVPEVTYLLAKDTSDNRAYRLCLHFKSAKELLGFWGFCELLIQKKIDTFTDVVLDCFNKSEQQDFDLWFQCVEKENIIQLFLNNNLEDVVKIFGNTDAKKQEMPPEKRVILANKLKQKFKVTDHNTGKEGYLFDFLTKTPTYFSNDIKDRMSSTLKWYGFRNNPDYEKRFDGIQYEAMIVKEQYLLVRMEIGCHDAHLDFERLESAYVYGSGNYFIPQEKFNSVHTIICSAALSKHIEESPDPDNKPSCSIM